MKLSPGQSWASAVDEAVVIVVRAPDVDVSLTCGGVPMSSPAAPTEKVPANADSIGETLLGKRYVDPSDSLELLCTKGGTGILAVGGQPLEIKSARPLPASD